MSTSKVSKSMLDTWGPKVVASSLPPPHLWRRARRVNRLGKVGLEGAF